MLRKDRLAMRFDAGAAIDGLPSKPTRLPRSAKRAASAAAS
jgi:hypothetical protein